MKVYEVPLTFAKHIDILGQDAGERLQDYLSFGYLSSRKSQSYCSEKI